MLSVRDNPLTPVVAVLNKVIATSARKQLAVTAQRARTLHSRACEVRVIARHETRNERVVASHPSISRRYRLVLSVDGWRTRRVPSLATITYSACRLVANNNIGNKNDDPGMTGHENSTHNSLVRAKLRRVTEFREKRGDGEGRCSGTKKHRCDNAFSLFAQGYLLIEFQEFDPYRCLVRRTLRDTPGIVNASKRRHGRNLRAIRRLGRA